MQLHRNCDKELLDHNSQKTSPQHTVESSVGIPQKNLNGSAFDPAIPLLGIYLKEPKTLIQKNISSPMFIAALFTITKVWKQSKCPSVDEWIKQLGGTFAQWNSTQP